MQIQYESLLKEAAVALVYLIPQKCGCESGGGMGDLDPGFTCGPHKLLERICNVVGEPEIPEDEPDYPSLNV